jgi:hypothetical protein
VLRVLYPNGGETLTSGNTVNIRWLTNMTVMPVAKTTLQYTTNGITWNPIKTLSGNLGLYPCLVPSVPSTTCKVKVILKDANGIRMVIDTSDRYFTIQP